MAKKIFLNYRREDSGANALAIASYLERAFGADNVFIDVDRLRPGQQFHKELEKRLSDCKVMLSIIGPGWLDARNEAGDRRIDDPDDWVRLEIERALALDIVVIPLLVGGASLPKAAHLPEVLKPLIERHAVAITTSGFRSDMAGLTRDIRAIKGDAPWARIGAGIGALALAGAAIFALSHQGKTPNSLAPATDMHQADDAESARKAALEAEKAARKEAELKRDEYKRRAEEAERRSEQATEEAKKNKKPDPEYDVKYNLDKYLREGRHDEAIAVLSKIIARSPDAEDYDKRGQVYADKKYYDNAIVDYANAIDLYKKVELTIFLV